MTKKQPLSIRLLAVLLSLLLVVPSGVLVAATSGMPSITVSGTTATVKGYTASADIVAAISTGGAYESLDLSSVKELVMKTVTELTAFKGNSSTSLWNTYFPAVEEINLSDSAVTELAYDQFRGCTTLKKVVLPTTVRSFLNRAFQSCTALTTVSVDASANNVVDLNGLTNTPAFGIDVFKSCTSLENVIIPNGVTALSGTVFQHCTGLKTVTLPDGFESLGSRTFGALQGNTTMAFTINIPDSMTEIPALAFDRASGYTVKYAGNVDTVQDLLLSPTGMISASNGTKPIYDFSGSDISAAQIEALAGYSGYENRVQKIILKNCPQFLDYTPVAGSVLAVLDAAGKVEWPTLMPIVLVEDGTATFKDFASAQDLLTAIQNDVALKELTDRQAITKITFNSPKLTDLELFAHSANKSGWAVQDSAWGVLFPNLTEIDFSGTSMKQIPARYFGSDQGAQRNNTIQKITFPNTVTSIGMRAFQGCEMLQEVYFAAGTTAVTANTYAFLGCRALTTVVLPKNMETLPDGTFQTCDALTSLTLPENLKEIKLAFIYHSSQGGARTERLVINLPSTVTTIAQDAFKGSKYITFKYSNADETSANVFFDSFFGANGPLNPTAWGIGNVELDFTGSAITPQKLETLAAVSDYATKIDKLTLTGCNTFLGHTPVSGGVLATLTDASKVVWPVAPKEIIVNGDTVTISGYNASAEIVADLASRTDLAGVKKVIITHAAELSAFATSGTSLWNTYFPAMEEIDLTGTIVTALPHRAFMNCTTVKKVFLPMTVTAFNNNVFDGCAALTTVSADKTDDNIVDLSTLSGSFNSTLYSCFKNCTSIETVVLHPNMTALGGSAFQQCTGLRNITLSPVLESIGNRALGGLSANTSMPFTVTLPDSITAIDALAFDRIKDYTIVYGGNNATVLTELFKANGMISAANGTKPTFDLSGSGVTATQIEALSGFAGYADRVQKIILTGCSQFVGYVPTAGGVLATLNAQSKITWPVATPVITVDNGTATFLNHATAEDLLAAILAHEALNTPEERGLITKIVVNSTALTNLNLFAHSADKGGWAVQDSAWGILFPNLTELDLSKTAMTSLPARYFGSSESGHNNTVIKKVTLPNTISSIGMRVFQGCSALEEVYFAAGNTAVTASTYMFLGCKALKTVVMPQNMEVLPDGTFQTCDALTTLVLPQNLKEIKLAFIYHSSQGGNRTDRLVIELPNTVTTIARDAFKGSRKITFVYRNTDATATAAFCTQLFGALNPSSWGIGEIELDFAGSAVTEAMLDGIKNVTDYLNKVIKVDLTGCPQFGNPHTLMADSALKDLNNAGKVVGITIYDPTVPEATITTDNGEVIATVNKVTKLEHIKAAITAALSTYNTANGTALTNADITTLVLSSLPGDVYTGHYQDDDVYPAMRKFDLSGVTFKDNTLPVIGSANPMVEELILPEGLTTIPENCFYKSSIKKITLPSTLQTIGKAAFWECTKLEEINLPSGLKTLGINALQTCVELKNPSTNGILILPDSLEVFGVPEKSSSVTANDQTVNLSRYMFYAQKITGIEYHGIGSDAFFTNMTGALRFCGTTPLTYVDLSNSGVTHEHIAMFPTSIQFLNLTGCTNIDKDDEAMLAYIETIQSKGATVIGLDETTDVTVLVKPSPLAGGLVSGDTVFKANQLPGTVTFTAEPNTVYTFAGWSVGTTFYPAGAPDANGVYSLTLNNITDFTYVVAKFDRKPEGVANLTATITTDGADVVATVKDAKKMDDIKVAIEAALTVFNTNNGTELTNADITKLVLSTPENGEFSGRYTDMETFPAMAKYDLTGVVFKDSTVPSIGSSYAVPVIQEIILPEGVRKLADRAFINLKDLKTLVLPSTLVEIGDGGALSGLGSLETLILPDGLKKLGVNATQTCPNLTQIGDEEYTYRLPDSLEVFGTKQKSPNNKANDMTQNLSRYMFYLLSDKVTKLEYHGQGDEAFFVNLIGSLNTSNSFTTLDFKDSGADEKSLVTLNFKKQYTYIDLRGCPIDYTTGRGKLLKDMIQQYIDNGATVLYDDGIIRDANLIPLELNVEVTGSVKAAVDAAIAQYNADPNNTRNVAAEDITKLTLKTANGVKLTAADFEYMRKTLSSIRTLDLSGTEAENNTIPDKAFYEMESMTTFLFPKNITAIGEKAFGFAGIETVNIPSTVVEIGSDAFANCYSLGGDLVLPNGLKKLGNESIFSQSMFTSITYHGDLDLFFSKNFGVSYASLKVVDLRGCSSLSETTFPKITYLTAVKRVHLDYCSFDFLTSAGYQFDYSLTLSRQKGVVITINNQFVPFDLSKLSEPITGKPDDDAYYPPFPPEPEEEPEDTPNDQPSEQPDEPTQPNQPEIPEEPDVEEPDEEEEFEDEDFDEEESDEEFEEEEDEESDASDSDDDADYDVGEDEDTDGEDAEALPDSGVRSYTIVAALLLLVSLCAAALITRQSVAKEER